MSEYQLAAEPRTDTGKGAARRARAGGRLPAVLYGHGIEPEHLTVDAREFRQALRSGGANALITLRLGRVRHLAMPREIQRHPVRGTYTHVDFLVVRRGEKVTVPVPVHVTGDPPGVVQGGVLGQDLHQVNVEAEVTNVPEAIEGDVSGLEIGDVLRVGDLKPPEGVTILDDPETTVASVVAPTVEPEVEEEEEEAVAEGEAAEEGEEAEPAAGGEGAEGER
ncbi:MAG TPA: 50S ribosomal protein L25/general stress protein Ctc [Actinomycetes bacterium]|jgi:large subunit ribosomal protein L25|nr:50S ribosomal protein L25/general stress protein Ctc [Actinomycetes bacterium]